MGVKIRDQLMVAMTWQQRRQPLNVCPKGLTSDARLRCNSAAVACLAVFVLGIYAVVQACPHISKSENFRLSLEYRLNYHSKLWLIGVLSWFQQSSSRPLRKWNRQWFTVTAEKVGERLWFIVVTVQREDRSRRSPNQVVQS